jgi:hypothetical protein
LVRNGVGNWDGRWLAKMTYLNVTSSNHDVDNEVISVGNSIGKRKIATFVVRHTVSRQLLIPLGHTIGEFVAIILRGNDDTGLISGKVRDDVTPTLVVVDAQCNDKVLSGVRHETKGARRSARAHREHVGSVRLAPRYARIFPARLLDDVEECILVGLVNLCGDRVTHSRRDSQSIDKRR